MSFKPTSYRLMNVATGRVFDDAGWTMGDPEGGSPSLVRAVYENKRFTPRDDLDGIYRYAEWMPIKRTLRKSCAPVTYKSKGLARYLGLENLYITFSGWNPRIKARMRTCSFKETEAYSVLARMDASEKRILVVQSAGNTARAFAQVCSDNRIPIVICVPEDNLHDLWFRRKLHPCVKLVAVPRGCDYYDAIALGEKLATDPRYMLEGGAKNVARRDGMGTTLLSCVEKMGRIPDAYFQAVGSGTGAIAAWENACRLGEDGRFGENKKALVEEYIAGVEATVGILLGKALPLVEIRYPGKLYDYEAKYTPGATKEICPPTGISAEAQEEAKKLALSFAKAIGAETLLRVDVIIRSSDDKVFVLEGNSMPGCTSTSLLPQAALAGGISLMELYSGLVMNAYRKK